MKLWHWLREAEQMPAILYSQVRLRCKSGPSKGDVATKSRRRIRKQLPRRKGQSSAKRAAICVGITALLLSSAACLSPPRRVYLDIATTTSVKNSGLLDALLPELLAETAITTRVHAAGSGRALEMLADAVVDLAITHAPRRENEYLTKHPDWAYRKMAFNRFVIVGPPYDPAKIHQANSAVEALSRIAAADVNFISRNDGSGTHERESQLWEAAGSRPGEGRLIVSGGSMAVALRHADERVAYTLSDEATFRQFEAQLELSVLFANDEQLLNTYALVYAPGVPQAVTFAEWLSHGAGRRRLETYTVAGAAAFFVWPENCPAARPDARPCVP